MSSVLAGIKCYGCRRRIGWSTSMRVPVAWCSDFLCMEQPQVTPNETRDDAAFLLSKLGKHPREIAELLGVSRQRAIQIIDARASSAPSSRIAFKSAAPGPGDDDEPQAKRA